jgi:MOSC domain-containing protein YiiM
MSAGTVVCIFLAPRGRAEPVAVDEAVATPGRGLAGDRYANGTGTFFEDGKPGQDLTLIEAEALAALRDEHDIHLPAAEARRNVVTRGIGLNDLVGRRFAVGEVVCRGDRLCDPCRVLERMTEPGVLAGLAGRGGLRADVVVGGTIRPGDAIRLLDD